MSDAAVFSLVVFVGIAAWSERSRLRLAVRTLFFRRTAFRLPDVKPLPAGIYLREYQSQDRDACLKLYADNEAGQFPAGFSKDFEYFLDRQDLLKLVLCEQSIPVAIGGIQLHPYLTTHCAWLIYGIVAPDWQARGLGTAMLVSRIALLPEPSSSTRLFMTNVPKTMSFFAHFGFASQGMLKYRVKLHCSSAILDDTAWRNCRLRVRALGLALPDMRVPAIDLRVPRHIPRDPAARGRTGFSKHDEAILLQLGGLVALLVLRPGGIWPELAALALSASLIVWGGILYRRELKRRKGLEKLKAPKDKDATE